MKSKEEFKKRFAKGEFDELLKAVKSPEDVVKIANNLGYELTIDDFFSSELDDDMLSLVAGGKNDKHYHYHIDARSNTQIDNSMTHNGNGNQGRV